MADATYQPGVYRSSGGDQFEVVSSGRIVIDSGGEIDVLAGGRLEIAGVSLITSGGAVVLTTAISKGNIHTTGSVTGVGGFVSTGASFSSTGSGTAATFDAVTSTGTGTFNAVTSTGTGTFNAVTSTGTGTFNAVTSTGTGTFNAVTSTGTGTFNAVTSTGTGTFNAVTSTGTGTFNAVTTTGTSGAISGGRVTANLGFVPYVESLTSGSTAIAAYGITHLTASTALTIMLAAPVAGLSKWISVVTTAASVTITSTEAGADIGGSTTITATTGTLVAPAWINLVGQNSTSWRVLGMSANVSVS